jgi:modulator of FtsH protease
MYDTTMARRGYGISTNTLFARTMTYVAATAGLFALGAYVGRNLGNGAGFIAFIAAFAALIAMRFTSQRSQEATVALLGAFGLLMGVAMAPTLVYYATADPQALWQAGGATALFIAALGSAGYATNRDLSGVARASFWGLLLLLVFGIVAIFVRIPHAALIWSVAGLVIFAGFTLVDFQRLRRSQNIAASIFLDILNVFLFFLNIFGSRD